MIILHETKNGSQCAFFRNFVALIKKLFCIEKKQGNTSIKKCDFIQKDAPTQRKVHMAKNRYHFPDPFSYKKVPHVRRGIPSRLYDIIFSFPLPHGRCHILCALTRYLSLRSASRSAEIMGTINRPHQKLLMPWVMSKGSPAMIQAIMPSKLRPNNNACAGAYSVP